MKFLLFYFWFKKIKTKNIVSKKYLKGYNKFVYLCERFQYFL